MARRRAIVVDASVARAAGGDPGRDGWTGRCACLLRDILEICHCAWVVPALRTEYRHHRSGFFRRWERSMLSRKKVRIGSAPGEERLRVAIRQSLASARAVEAMEKDLHLILAALESDRIVVSLDRSARQHFAELARTVAELRPIVWVDLTTVTREEARDWLKAGAPARRDWYLGAPLL